MNTFSSSDVAHRSTCNCCPGTRQYAAKLPSGGYVRVTMCGPFKLRAHGPNGALAYGHREVLALIAGEPLPHVFATVEAEVFALPASASA